MEGNIQWISLLAGLGIFLFGMTQLEGALRLLAGRPFKRFLGRYTGQPWQGSLAGVLATAALQSSSVVSLIVMAFVGTGVISLASGISIGFGSNLGTTATGWIVATLGFRLDIEALALPLIAVGGFGAVWLAQQSRYRALCHLLLGLGFMLLGLDYMKTGAASVASSFDPVALREYPLLVYFLLGFFLTMMIQSSSATITIALSALYAKVIPLSAGAAVAVGADLGTTITAVLGALAGSPSKKRVAAALVLFNGVTDFLAFVFIHPLLYVVGEWVGVRDPLFALVTFHSLFNFLGIVLFLPWVGALSRYLEKFFIRREASLLHYLQDFDPSVPGAALESIGQETQRLVDHSIGLNRISMGLKKGRADGEQAYEELKSLEGAILAYALRLQGQEMSVAEATRLSQVFSAIRNGVHSAKCLRDTQHDLKAFRDSAEDSFHDYEGRFGDVAKEFYEAVEGLAEVAVPSLIFERLVQAKDLNESAHADMHSRIYHEFREGQLKEEEVSTILNVNRQVFLSNLNLVNAFADLLLDEKGIEDFHSLPLRG